MVLCAGLTLGCSEGPEGETSTTLMTGNSSFGDLGDDDMDEADEVETDDEETDASTGSSSSSDDSDDSSESDDLDTSSSTTSTTNFDESESEDGDTLISAQCGWFEGGPYYECGYEGADPGGTPFACPPGLVDGDPCTDTGITGQGCCDANGDNWYCGEDGSRTFVVFNPCD